MASNNSGNVIPSECPMHAQNVSTAPPPAMPANHGTLKSSGGVIPSECPMHQSNVGAAPADDLDPANMVSCHHYRFNIINLES